MSREAMGACAVISMIIGFFLTGYFKYIAGEHQLSTIMNPKLWSTWLIGIFLIFTIIIITKLLTKFFIKRK